MSFWAITANSIKLLLRSKVPVFALLLIGLVIPFASYFMFTADGTLSGVLRTMLNFNYYIILGVLTLLTLYFSAVVLDSELAEEQMTLLCTKSVHRYSIVLAKWLAVTLTIGGVLIIMWGATYAALKMRCSTENIVEIRKATPQTKNFTAQMRLQDAEKQLFITNKNFFTARKTYQAEVHTVDHDAEDMHYHMNLSKIPKDKRPSDLEIRTFLRMTRKKKAFPLTYGSGKHFDFVGIPMGLKELLIRYKIKGVKKVGELNRLQARWEIGGRHTPSFFHRTDFKPKTTQEFFIPGKLVAKNGTITATIINDSAPEKGSAPGFMEIPEKDGIVLLAKSGGFLWNFIKGMLLIWIQLTFLAAVGVGFSTFVSAPITAFVLLGVIMPGFMFESLEQDLAPPPIIYFTQPMSAEKQVKRAAITALQVFPNFADTNPVDALGTGTEITYTKVLIEFFWVILLRGGIILSLGSILFTKREIGIPRAFR